MDADSSTDLGDLAHLVAALEFAHVASVPVRGRRPGRQRPEVPRSWVGPTRVRRANSPASRSATRSAGSKAFRSAGGQAAFGLSTVDRFAFDIEVLHRASVMGFRIAEVPVRWNHVEGSKVRRDDSLDMAVDTFRTTRGGRSATVATLHVTHRGHEVDEAIATLPVRALVRRGTSRSRSFCPEEKSSRTVVNRHLRERGVRAVSRERSGFELARPLRLHRWEITSDVAVPPAAIVESIDLSRAIQDSGRRVLRRGKYLVGHDPAFLPILLRATPMGTEKRITRDTDIVVEGFPRSGNTFAVFALRDASDGRLSVASHVHHPSQVKLAVRKGLPTLLVIREPVACLASYLIAGPHGRRSRSSRSTSGTTGNSSRISTTSSSQTSPR